MVLGSSRDFGAGGDQCHPCKVGHFPQHSCRMAFVKRGHPNQAGSPLIGFQGLNSFRAQTFASRGLCGLSGENTCTEHRPALNWGPSKGCLTAPSICKLLELYGAVYAFHHK